MILFYDKQTGKIVGTVNGRVHSPQELEMWVGSKEENGRIVVEWKPTGKEYEVEVDESKYVEIGVDDFGESIFRREVTKKKITKQESEPQTNQKEIFKQIDKNSMDAYKYKVDIQTQELVLL